MNTSGLERRSAVTPAVLWGALGGWLAIAALFVATRWHKITTLDFDDVDDQLRLVQVRDLLAGQGWFDLTQYRIDPPLGVAMHWSRLVDLPLALVYRLSAPLLGPELAERAMLVIVPMLTLGAVLYLTGRLAMRLFDAEIAALACLLVVLAPPVAGQLQPLRIDHHGWQIVAVLAALNGLFARRSAVGAWTAGLALALGMAISLELLPIAALIGGVFALRWLEDPREPRGLTHFVAALALGSVGAFLLTRGLADLSARCDAISPPYLAGLTVLASGLAVLERRAARRGVLLAAGLGLAGVLALATTLALAPNCSRGPFEALDPLVRDLWYANVLEGRPVWLQPINVMLQMVVPPAVGLLAAVRLWLRGPEPQRPLWRDYTLVLAGLLVLAMAVSRSSAFACAAGAVPLAWQVREWLRGLRRTKDATRRAALVMAILAAVMPGALGAVAAKLQPDGKAVQARPDPMRVCDIRSAGRALDHLPPATILAPLDIGPTLLTYSRHRVVATGHHRAAPAMRDAIAAFTGTPAEARAIVLRHGARYILLCPALPEVINYRDHAPTGFTAQLMRGQVPGWLRPVRLDPRTGVLVSEVIQAPPADQPGMKPSASPFMQ